VCSLILRSNFVEVAGPEHSRPAVWVEPGSRQRVPLSLLDRCGLELQVDHLRRLARQQIGSLRSSDLFSDDEGDALRFLGFPVLSHSRFVD
jgi:hypothetical protein